MADLQQRVRERLRQQILQHGGSPALQDPALFAEVDRLLSVAAAADDARTLLLPEILGEPTTWRLETSIRYPSHRGSVAASVLRFVKRRVMMPALRWLFEYSQENFARQRRVNQVLFACVQELAIETARLRRDAQRPMDAAAPRRDIPERL
jgi:hypothetical protein